MTVKTVPGSRSLPAGLLAGALISLTGCGGFFVPNTTNTGGGGTASGTDRVYVMASTAQTISGFTLGTGTLTAVSGNPLAVSFAPQAAVVSRDGSHLYVGGPGTLSLYDVASDGSLSAAGAVYLATVASLDVSPDGQWLFGLDLISQVIDEWQINSDGTLNTVQPLQYSIGKGVWSPKSLRVAPSGALIFAAVGTAGDVVFTLDTTTGLVAQSQTLGPVDSQTSDNAFAINSGSTTLYLARSGTSGGLGVYSIGLNGLLTPISGSPYATGNGSNSIALEGTGKYVYVANRADSTISGFAIGTTGALTALTGSPFAAGTGVTSIGVDSSGDYLLAAASGGTPDLALYSFDTTTPGKLISAATKSVGTAPTGASIVALTH